ncbi:ArsR family transcriptional regulator [Paraflavitalea speifideaquila]|uniref:ArsR/SmtB family transcription factor n=1 Tax=Paraflavitalea speifideaquila TaxID=3076558 RepID=UPI0028F0DC26
MQHLLKANACINGDLVEVLSLAQPTISQHLKELKTAGLIQGAIEGTSVCYCIEPKTWALYQKRSAPSSPPTKAPTTAADNGKPIFLLQNIAILICRPCSTNTKSSSSAFTTPPGVRWPKPS